VAVGLTLEIRVPEGSEGASSGLRCPRCNGPIWRIKRRLVDRIVSLLTPVRRYHCSNYCGWEGNLRDVRVAAAAPSDPVREKS
jgi:hypothetical protein